MTLPRPDWWPMVGIVDLTDDAHGIDWRWWGNWLTWRWHWPRARLDEGDPVMKWRSGGDCWALHLTGGNDTPAVVIDLTVMTAVQHLAEIRPIQTPTSPVGIVVGDPWRRWRNPDRQSTLRCCLPRPVIDGEGQVIEWPRWYLFDIVSSTTSITLTATTDLKMNIWRYSAGDLGEPRWRRGNDDGGGDVICAKHSDPASIVQWWHLSFIRLTWLTVATDGESLTTWLYGWLPVAVTGG